MKPSPAGRRADQGSVRSPDVIAYRRRLLEKIIEDAIALLDAIDGDPDLEGDEIEMVGYSEGRKRA